MLVKLNCGLQGIWGGMIFGGTAIQTVILVIITVKCDWDKEVYIYLLFTENKIYCSVDHTEFMSLLVTQYLIKLNITFHSNK